MSDDVVNVPGLPSASTKAVDSSSLTVNAATVLRQRINISDPHDPLAHALVASGDFLDTNYGLSVRPIMRSEGTPGNPTPSRGVTVGGDDGSGNFIIAQLPGGKLAVVLQSEGSLGNFAPGKALLVAGSDNVGDLVPFRIIGGFAQTFGISDGSPGAPPPNGFGTGVQGLDQNGNLVFIPVLNGQLPVSIRTPIGVSGSVSAILVNPIGVSGSVSILNSVPVIIQTPLGISGSVSVLNQLTGIIVSNIVRVTGGDVTVRPAAPSVSNTLHVSVDIQVSGDTVLVAGVAGQTIRVMRGLFTLMSSGGMANIVRFKDTTPQNLSGPLYFFDGGMTLDNSGDPWYVTAVGKGLVINQTQLGQIGGDIWYTQS